MDEKELIEKYKKRLREELGVSVSENITQQILSREYKDFKAAFLPKHLTAYESICKIAEKTLKVKADSKRVADLEEAIKISHLEATPAGTTSFAALISLLVFLLVFAFSLFNYRACFSASALKGCFIPSEAGIPPELTGLLFFIFIGLIAGFVLINPLQRLPEFLANNWRLKSSNQMVQCIFYIVTYMRHTSNLERAIEFASDHVGPPLSLDLKKVLWDVETGEYSTIKDSLESYLKTWEKWNREFIESFHLIESSLYEPSESRRLDVLDKALSVILTETYEKMLHYAHNLQSPVTMLHMLGIILPILGLVILPLVVSFMASDETPPSKLALIIAMLYNIILPVGVYYLTKLVLSKRPTGYGQTDITEQSPELAKYKKVLLHIGSFELKIAPAIIAGGIFLLFFFIGVSPLIIHAYDQSYELLFYDDAFKLLGYVCPKGIECKMDERIGPYGLGAGVLSLFVTLSIGIGAGTYFALRSKNVFKIRENTKKLEEEFASSLFQLGNRLGDGLPAEIAFGKVASLMQGTASGDFFELVSRNITRLGMSVENAIFNPKTGALVYYPSKVIEGSMKVLVESSKKGPKTAAQALISMSRYIKEIHRVDERLKDLLAEIISSMKGQIKFLTPAIAGIVIGITSMITTILISLSENIARLTQQGTDISTSAVASIPDLFGNGVPAYYFQIIVGIYVVQITFILTILSNGIENGSDKLNERYLIGKYLLNSTVLYCIISLAVMLIFNYIAAQIMPGMFG